MLNIRYCGLNWTVVCVGVWVWVTYRCYRCVYLVDGGFEEQCGWKSCRSDRTKKENRHTVDLILCVEQKIMKVLSPGLVSEKKTSYCTFLRMTKRFKKWTDIQFEQCKWHVFYIYKSNQIRCTINYITEESVQDRKILTKNMMRASLICCSP